MDGLGKGCSHNKSVGEINLNDAVESIAWLIKQESFKKCIFILCCAGVLTVAAVHTGTYYTPVEDVFVYCTVYCSWITLCLPWLIQNLDGKMLGMIMNVVFRLFAADVGVLAWSAFRGDRHLLHRGLRLKPLLEPSLSWLSQAGYNLRYGVVVAAVVASVVSLVLDKYEGVKNNEQNKTPDSVIKTDTSGIAQTNRERKRPDDDKSIQIRGQGQAVDEGNGRVGTDQNQECSVTDCGQQHRGLRGLDEGHKIQDNHSYDVRNSSQGLLMDKDHHLQVAVQSQDLSFPEDCQNAITDQKRFLPMGESPEHMGKKDADTGSFPGKEINRMHLTEDKDDDPQPQPQPQHQLQPQFRVTPKYKTPTRSSLGNDDNKTTQSTQYGAGEPPKFRARSYVRPAMKDNRSSTHATGTFSKSGMFDKGEVFNKTTKASEAKSVMKRETMPSAVRMTGKAKIEIKKAENAGGATPTPGKSIVNKEENLDNHQCQEVSGNRNSQEIVKECMCKEDRKLDEENTQRQEIREPGCLNESMRNLISLKQRLLHLD